jgi:hypothetical protein
MDFRPRDVIAPPRARGSDVITYLAGFAEHTDEPNDWDRWTHAADVIDSTLWYTASLDATPDSSVIRWLPPDESGLPTVIVFSQGNQATPLIRHGRDGPSACRP